MKIQFAQRFLPAMVCVFALNACGGGNDDAAGAPTPLSVSPNDITVTGPTVPAGNNPVCPGNVPEFVEVFVYGGTAPYRLDNHFALSGVILNKTQVQHPGQSFRVSFSGGCVDPAGITILDSLGNKVELNLHFVPGDVGA